VNSSLTQKVIRPIGVTIIAILTIIIGLITLFAGISLVALGAFLTIAPIDITSGNNTTPPVDDGSQFVMQFFGIISAIVGAIMLAVGIGYIVMFYGLLKGTGWAWTITIILIIIGIAIQIVSGITGTIFNASMLGDSSATNSVISGIVGSVIGIAINIVILYYLYRPQVKIFFGKTQQSKEVP
jgi:hypothetical protein